MQVGLVDHVKEKQPRLKGHFQVIIFSESLLLCFIIVFKNLGEDEVLTSATHLLKSSFINQKLTTGFVKGCCELWR